jgi:hypothetical protein
LPRKRSIDQQAQDEAVAFAKEKVHSNGTSESLDPALVTLSTGIVIRCKPVPRVLFEELLASMPEPEAPVIYLEDKQRSEENPNDPAYLREQKDWIKRLGLATINTMILFGTAIESIPDDIDPPGAAHWRERLALVGLAPSDDSEDAQYLFWIRCYAAASAQDLAALQGGVTRLSGQILEQAVGEAARSFRNRAERRADRGGDAAGGGDDGDTVTRPAPRRRTRNR